MPGITARHQSARFGPKRGIGSGAAASPHGPRNALVDQHHDGLRYAGRRDPSESWRSKRSSPPMPRPLTCCKASC